MRQTQEKTKMLHAREDYNRIQDPENKIPEDEPVFLLRGQDFATVQAMEAYADTLEIHPDCKDVVTHVREHIKKVLHWQNTVKCKLPDMPDGT
jgi:hypothetical protein